MMEKNDQNAADDLQTRIERLDHLIQTREDGVRGLGVRLALGIAQELREARAPGSLTGELVQAWVEKFGIEAVDDAVAQARVLLKDPAKMAQELGKRLDPALAESLAPSTLRGGSDAPDA